jgi:hypothetical protein
MGRTLPTATQTLAEEKESWAHFRRTLRKEDQDVFDALWRWARRHTAPMSMASRPVPFESVVMAMLVEIARRLPPDPVRDENLPGMGL